MPVRLVDESMYDGVVTPLMTYDVTYQNLGAQPEADFQLPPEYSHKSCTRHVGGFPYIHAFHHYLRF